MNSRFHLLLSFYCLDYLFLDLNVVENKFLYEPLCSISTLSV